jgi:hypothetical protein
VTLCFDCGGDHVEKWWDKNAIKYELFLLESKMKNTNIKIIRYLMCFCTTMNIFRNVFNIDVKMLNDTCRLNCICLFIYTLFSLSILSGYGTVNLCLRTRI